MDNTDKENLSSFASTNGWSIEKLDKMGEAIYIRISEIQKGDNSERQEILMDKATQIAAQEFGFTPDDLDLIN